MAIPASITHKIKETITEFEETEEGPKWGTNRRQSMYKLGDICPE